MEVNKNTPFWDVSLPVEQRLDWLLSEMTMDEKLGMLATKVPALERLGIPAMSVGGEAAHGVEARNDQNELGGAETTTSFPQPIGMSATWDTELIREAGEVTGTEARVIYHRHPDRGLSRWAPTIDLERDPRWGRTEEGYGEDPLLIGEMSSAYIRGMQGDDPHYLRVASTLKHFYANNTEVGRGWKNSSIDPRNKYELYLEPFRRAIENGGAEAVMTAYNKINGIPGMLNPEVTSILKDQYGLKHAVCDGGAMELVADFHHYCGLHAETLAMALKAGIDGMSDNPEVVEQAAREAYELGLITKEDVDRALRNMFRTKIRLGVYDKVNRNPYDNVTEEDINSERHQEICRQVSRESIVLLKNEKEMLPLAKNTPPESLALIGPAGDCWYRDWYCGEPLRKTTLKQGIEKLQNGEVCFADGYDKVIFKCGDKGITVAEDNSLILSENPDAFFMEDWGEGSLYFRCVRTGKYMNTRFYPGKVKPEELGKIAADIDEPFDWFVMEIFHLEEQPDKTVVLTNRFGSPVLAGEDGSLWSMKGGEQIGPSVGLEIETAKTAGRDMAMSEISFTLEVVESGVEAACKLAQGKETVLLALGCNPMVNAREEVDRTTIALPPAQERLLEAVYKVNPHIVLVILSNYPYAVNAAKEKIPAILWSATGSQDMGEALAETIFGENAPAGRLNMTWHCDDKSLPDIDDYDIIKGKRTYRYFTGKTLYPFGFGLTYSAFSYSALSVKLADKRKLLVSFSVKNTGTRTSDEVAQVYGSAPASRVEKPIRQLLGFTRLKNIKPGESRMVEMEIPVEEFRFYDVISRSLMVEKGLYTIYAGTSSADDKLSVSIEIPGDTPGVRDMTAKTAADHYDDYENIVLTKGQFHYSAAQVLCPEKEGVLIYRDCAIMPETKEIILHLCSEKGGAVEVLVDGEKAGSWQGETRTYVKNPRPVMGPLMRKDTEERIASWKPVYADVRVELSQGKKTGQTPVELTIKMDGDVKLCYFRLQ
ncbi:MAG: glycoside hydrolase family 3 C-terminal domain-containing protein [Bacillus sp. (in: Bacteria)]|nr:glycoside hydrolase family 3 C-terminal domain-containing protein [Bacillus sp. (in: firmicutes)]MCM1425745.1 glycoside hydrolase family 3 C-terminal domain-containing protein [Eubacterium sp.]